MKDIVEISEDARNIASKYQEFQRETRKAVRQEMSMIQVSISSCDQTIIAINELKAASAEGKIAQTMVPVGFGSFVYAEVKNADRIIVDLGAGFRAEKTVAEAIETLNNRKEQLQNSRTDERFTD